MQIPCCIYPQTIHLKEPKRQPKPNQATKENHHEAPRSGPCEFRSQMSVWDAHRYGNLDLVVLVLVVVALLCDCNRLGVSLGVSLVDLGVRLLGDGNLRKPSVGGLLDNGVVVGGVLGDDGLDGNSLGLRDGGLVPFSLLGGGRDGISAGLGVDVPEDLGASLRDLVALPLVDVGAPLEVVLFTALVVLAGLDGDGPGNPLDVLLPLGVGVSLRDGCGVRSLGLGLPDGNGVLGDGLGAVADGVGLLDNVPLVVGVRLGVVVGDGLGFLLDPSEVVLAELNLVEDGLAQFGGDILVDLDSFIGTDKGREGEREEGERELHDCEIKILGGLRSVAKDQV
jgi:hypothetical protein